MHEIRPAKQELRGSQDDRHLLGEDHPRGYHIGRRIRLCVLDNIGTRIGSRDDLGLANKLCVAPAMVGVMVRAQNVPDRLARDAPNLRHDLIVILLELIVHQNHSFRRDVHCNIAAVALNHV